MSNAEQLILAEIERLAPSDERIHLEWSDVLRRASRPVGQRGGRRLRWKTVVGVAVAVMVATPTVAFSNGVRSLLGLTQSRPVPKTERLILTAPVGNGFYAHLFTSASTTGGRCQLVAADHTAASAAPFIGGGGGCSVTGSSPVGLATKNQPLDVGFSISRRLREGNPANWVPPIVSGNIYAGLGATKVEIRWRTSHYRLTLQHGYFLGGTPKLYMPPFQAFPFYVVAYNAKGREVARKKLDNPGLLMLSGGWKEYARQYHQWAKTHKR